MEQLIERFIQGAAATRELPELEAVASGALAQMGIDAYMLRERRSVESFGLFDRQFLAQYRSNGFDRVDPVARQVDASWLPVTWDCGDYLSNHDSQCSEMWHRARDMGYERGISVPINGPCRQRYTLVGIYSGKLERLRDSHHALSSYLIVLGTHLAQAHDRITAAPSVRSRLLTRRETQCLSWTGKGKTAWEVAEIIGVSERTVNFHLQNAMAKLQSYSKHAACLKALDLGLIET